MPRTVADRGQPRREHQLSGRRFANDRTASPACFEANLESGIMDRREFLITMAAAPALAALQPRAR